MKKRKVYKKDCIGRVPSSIREIEECSMCENYHVCLSLMGAVSAEASSKNREARRAKPSES